MITRIRRESCFQIAALILPFALASTVMAGPVGSLQSIKLLTQEVGWAANSEDLFWTTDAGEHWENRTPATKTKEAIEDVFFLNASVGWILLARGDGNGQVQFDLASTEDAGESWQVIQLEISSGVDKEFSGRGSMFFLDRIHGWISLGINSGGAFRPGIMLSTLDGGATWTYAPGNPGVAGSFCFFNSRDGVFSGGPGDTEFYTTHDGSMSWHQVSLEASKVLPATAPTYGAPTCNGQNGFLPVTYSGEEGTKSALVVFGTTDAGHEFRPDRVLPQLDETTPGQKITTAIANADVVSLRVSSEGMLALTALQRRGVQTKRTFNLDRASAVIDASFGDTTHGWALTSFGLLSTVDGGATWTDITPTDVRGATLAESSAGSDYNDGEQITARPINEDMDEDAAASTASTKNTRMGFDAYLAPKAGVIMEPWWKFSPYYEIGIYLPGAANRHPTQPDSNLTSTWISTVSGYGWGLIPLWVGPQAPCVSQTGLTKISPTNAYSQGQTEAAKAIAAAKKLSSLLGPTIYYNMEPYASTAANGCSAVVTAFLNGWVNAMHSHSPKYNAGVYGTAPAAAEDFSRLSPLPADDIWVTAPPLPAQQANVSIWGLASQKTVLCDPFAKSPCTLWSKSERIHQYLLAHSETWGGQTLEVDKNIVNADVAVSNKKSKPLTFQYVIINCSNLTTENFQPLAINNSGEVVGYFFGTDGSEHGFKYSNNKCTALPDPPGKDPSPYPSGINDAGQIAGQYSTDVPGTANLYFLYDPAKSTPYTSIKIQNFNREPLGFNDDGQIVGTMGAGLDAVDGFEYNLNRSGAVTAINCKACDINGLNGDGYAIGYLDDTQTNFIYDLISKTPTTVKASASSGINDNMQILGNNVLYDFSTKTSISLANVLGSSQQVYTFGINDYAEVIGTSYDIKSGKGQAFILCPKGFPVCPVANP